MLQRRIDEDTLLPGKCRTVEESFFVYEQQLAFRVMEQPVPSAAALERVVGCVGYDTAFQEAYTALNLLPLQFGNVDQRDRAQACVLSVVGLILHTAGFASSLPSEDDVFDLIDNNPHTTRYHPDFWASLQALWRSPAVANVLLSRDALQGGIAARARKAEFESRQAADLAKKGLRACALPSCGKQKTTVLQFRVCGHCQRTRYCCPEHAKAHWKAHKREQEEEGEPSGGGGVSSRA